MGARKNINVTGSNKNTAATSGACTIGYFRICAASSGTSYKSNWTALTTSRTLSSGGMLNIADAGIYVTLGVTGSAVQGQISDGILQAMLDAQFAAGDYIAWSENGTSESTNLATRTAVDAWDNAIAF